MIPKTSVKHVSASIGFPVIEYLQTQMETTEDDLGFIARFKTVLIDVIKDKMNNWPPLDKYEISANPNPIF